MARPRGTSQYPEDEAVLDKMERELERGKYSSPWAAAGAYVDEVGGGEPSSRRRRLVDKFKKRKEAREEELWQLVGRALVGKSSAEKARILGRLIKTKREGVEDFSSVLLELKITGAAPRDEEETMLVLGALGLARALENARGSDLWDDDDENH